MEYESYINDVDNIFHQLRGHYILVNMREHFEFPDIKKPEKIKKEESSDKKMMQVSILEARIKKMQYIKMRRKGEKTEEESNGEDNLQSINSGGYYPLEQLWEKLNANDIICDDEKKKSWRVLTEDEKKEHLKEFAEKFKDLMDPEVWKEMRRDLIKQLKDGNFDNNNVINWHKGTQKILEISGLVINPACFYWT